jgi:hypothetical protein
MLAEVRPIEVDAQHNSSPTDEFILKRFKVFAQQTPAATRVQPSDWTFQIVPDSFTPNLLVPPKIGHDSALQPPSNRATETCIPQPIGHWECVSSCVESELIVPQLSPMPSGKLCAGRRSATYSSVIGYRSRRKGFLPETRTTLKRPRCRTTRQASASDVSVPALTVSRTKSARWAGLRPRTATGTLTTRRSSMPQLSNQRNTSSYVCFDWY